MGIRARVDVLIEAALARQRKKRKAMPDSLDALAKRAFLGDQEAWRELYAAMTPRLLGLARRRVPSLVEAEEIVQATWLKVIRNHGRYDPSLDFKNWIFTICVNSCWDHLRKAKTHLPRLLPVELIGPSFSEEDATFAFERQEELQKQGEQLRDCLERLDPPEYRTIIRLRFWEGLEHEAIGARLRETAAQIRGKCYRAILKLIECMGARSAGDT
jgi:RNA polymerase sigma-70 factor, ECF subfamily